MSSGRRWTIWTASSRSRHRRGVWGSPPRRRSIHRRSNPINAAFSPTAEEIAYAREVIAALAEAVAEGTGVLNYHGVFLEEPVIARARRMIEIAERFGQG